MKRHETESRHDFASTRAGRDRRQERRAVRKVKHAFIGTRIDWLHDAI